jgi:hypothetical protein
LKRVVALGVFAIALVAPLSGCSSTKDTPAARSGGGGAASNAAPSASPKPGELLAAAVTRLSGQNMKYTIDSGNGDVLTGSFDAKTGGNLLTGNVDGSKMDIIALGNDMYLGGLAPGGKYYHALASKFKDNGIGMLLLVDPLCGQKFLSTATGVKQDKPGEFTGTLDLTKVTVTGTAKRLADHFAKSAGATAAALPFTTTMDASGAIAAVTMTFPKADLGNKDLKYNLKITEVGGAVTVAAPPKNKVTEAPPDIYNGP